MAGDSEDEEYHEEEFRGILVLSQQANEEYARTGQASDLEECIAYLRDALTVAPRHGPLRADTTHKLAYDLYISSRDPGLDIHDEMQRLTESIHLHRHALKLLPITHPSRALYIAQLAMALRARFSRTFNREDLDECIFLYLRALSLRPPGHPDRPQSLMNLANAYFTRFEQTHDMEDLDAAIRLDEEALQLRAPGHPNRTASLHSLATDLSARFVHVGDTQDLERVIVLQREALGLATDSNRDTLAQQLAGHLYAHYRAARDSESLNEAMSLCPREPRIGHGEHPNHCKASTVLLYGILRFKLASCLDGRHSIFCIAKNVDR